MKKFSSHLFFALMLSGLLPTESFAAYKCAVIFDRLYALNEKERDAFITAARKAGQRFAKTLILEKADQRSDEYSDILQVVAEQKAQSDLKFTLAELRKYSPESIESALTNVIDLYTKKSKEFGVVPKLEELAQDLNITTEALKKLIGEGGLFKSEEDIFTVAARARPKDFVNVLDPRVYNEKRRAALEKSLKTKRRHIVVTAVPGEKMVEMDWFNSLLVYARKMDADILVIPALMQTVGLQEVLLTTPEVHIVTNNIKLSPELTINTTKIMVSQINSLAGLNRVGNRNSSQIYAGTKIQLETVPTLDYKYQNPMMLMTTGALTKAQYTIKHEVQDKQREIAVDHHALTALLIEKDFIHDLGNNVTFENQRGFYHFRHIRYSPGRKGFFEGNRFFSSDGTVVKGRADYIVLGDIHVGVTSSYFLEAFQQMHRYHNPHAYILHDFFDGRSVNEHEKDKLALQAMRFKAGELDLEKELRANAAFLNAMHAMAPDTTLVIVRASNHVEWINRFLNSYKQNSVNLQNKMLAEELLGVMNKGQDPYLYALIKFGLMKPQKIAFNVDATAKRMGVTLGEHGHEGPNGARPSEIGHKRSANAMSHGHTHYTYINGDHISVGTSTGPQDYQRGASSMSISYEVGHYSAEDAALIEKPYSMIKANPNRQVYIYNNGRLRADNRLSASDTANMLGSFHYSEYPYIVPRTKLNDGAELLNQNSHYIRNGSGAQ